MRYTGPERGENKAGLQIPKKTPKRNLLHGRCWLCTDCCGLMCAAFSYSVILFSQLTMSRQLYAAAQRGANGGAFFHVFCSPLSLPRPSTRGATPPRALSLSLERRVLFSRDRFTIVPRPRSEIRAREINRRSARGTPRCTLFFLTALPGSRSSRTPTPCSAIRAQARSVSMGKIDLSLSLSLATKHCDTRSEFWDTLHGASRHVASGCVARHLSLSLSHGAFPRLAGLLGCVPLGEIRIAYSHRCGAEKRRAALCPAKNAAEKRGLFARAAEGSAFSFFAHTAEDTFFLSLSR